MKVLIDGEEVSCQNDVKVIWSDTPDTDMEMHATLTHEGLILDTFTVQNGSDGKELGLEKTMSLDTEQLEGLCI